MKGHIVCNPIYMKYPNRQTRRDRKQINGCQGLGVGGGGGVTADRDRGSFWGDENVLELDRGDDCTTL